MTDTSPSGAGLVHTLIDALAAEYAADPWRPDVAAAREEYFTASGKVFEDDAELFEARMASFLEWYVVEAPLRGGPPPVLRALAGSSSEERRKALTRLATSHRSLFDVVAASGDRVELDDVLGGARFDVVERRSTVGFEVGALVEARLIWDGRQVVFGKTFLFHPRDAREEALAMVDAAMDRGTSHGEIMFQLCRLHVRWHRHGHTGAARVYRGGG